MIVSISIIWKKHHSNLGCWYLAGTCALNQMYNTKDFKFDLKIGKSREKLREHMILNGYVSVSKGVNKKEVFEKREIIGRPFPLEYPELEVFPVLADDICPNQKLKDVGIEYRFLNNELVAINFVALNYNQSKKNKYK